KRHIFSLRNLYCNFTNNIFSVILGKTGGRFLKMKLIDQQQVQEKLDAFTNKPVYIHLETTNGVYASHFENKGVNVDTYISNAQVKYTNVVIKGDIVYRVG